MKDGETDRERERERERETETETERQRESATERTTGQILSAVSAFHRHPISNQ